MHVFKAVKKHFLITFARTRAFLSIFNTALLENLLRQVSYFTIGSPILSTNIDPWPETTQNCGTSKPTSLLCLYGLGHVTCGRKRFCVCFPSHSGREEFYSSKWLPDAQREVLGLSRDTVDSLLSCPPSPPRPLTLWPIIPTCSFPCTNYPCNLIMWCQLKHWLSCQATTGQFLIKRFLDNPI